MQDEVKKLIKSLTESRFEDYSQIERSQQVNLVIQPGATQAESPYKSTNDRRNINLL